MSNQDKNEPIAIPVPIANIGENAPGGEPTPEFGPEWKWLALRGFALVGAIVVLLGCFGLYSIFHKRPVEIKVDRVYWKHTIEVQQYVLLHKSGFNETRPHDAFNIKELGQRFHHKGEECIMPLDDEFYCLKKEVDITKAWSSWDIWRWVKLEGRSWSKMGINTKTQWPTTGEFYIKKAESVSDGEKSHWAVHQKYPEGAEMPVIHKKYEVVLVDDRGNEYLREFPTEESFQNYPIGSIHCIETNWLRRYYRHLDSCPKD